MNQDFTSQLNEALKAVREARLGNKSDEELLSMIRVLRQWHSAEYAPAAVPAIEAIENEIARRQIASLHRKEMEHIGKLLEITEAQKQLAQEAGRQAENLTKQTDKLVSETIKLTQFTKTLVWLTIAVFVSAIVQIVIMLFEYSSHSHTN